MVKKLFLYLLLLSPTLSFAMPYCTEDGDGLKKEKVKDSSLEETFSWEFFSAAEKINIEDLATARDHKLGKEIGFLYELFMQGYIKKEEVVPGDPTKRTVIRKPNVYNAVRNIEKILNKKLKKTEITEGEASECFAHVLRVAIAVIDSDSDSFEDAIITNRKDDQKLIALFEKVKLTSIY